MSLRGTPSAKRPMTPGRAEQRKTVSTCVVKGCLRAPTQGILVGKQKEQTANVYNTGGRQGGRKCQAEGEKPNSGDYTEFWIRQNLSTLTASLRPELESTAKGREHFLGNESVP